MSALVAFAPSPIVPNPLSDELRGVINRLRFHATYCRAAAHLDFQEACRLISPDAAEDLVSKTFVRVLGQAMDRAPRWYRVGEPAFSFDELWVAKLIEARRDEDWDSVQFLLRRRVDRDKVRFVSVLITLLAAQIL